MNYSGRHAALGQYRRAGVGVEVTEASPHRRVQLLLGGMLERIAVAIGCMERAEIANKGMHISRAMAIVDALRAGLDHDSARELCGNLDSLYEYMTRRLVEANAYNRVDFLEEVAALVREIKLGWDAIAQQQPETQPYRAAAGV